MTLFDLYARISLDTSEFEKGISDATSKGSTLKTKLSGVFNGVSGLGKSAMKTAGVAAGAATTALGIFAKSSIEAGMNFDEGMAKVAAISGATGDDLEALRNKAIEMGSSTKFSASESSEAFQYMSMAGWEAGDMLDGIAGIMNLAAASGEDLATTSDIVTDAITAFGLSAGDAEHFADVLAVASSNANTNVGMMGETFKYVAPVAGAMGYSVEDTAEAIGLMANSGIKASQAGTSLRSMLTRLSTNAGASSKKLGALDILTKKLGVDFYNTDGTTRDLNDVLTDARAVWGDLTEEEQINYAKTIAGQEAMSGWLALMNASPKDIDKMENALANADGTADTMAKTMMDNLPGSITYFKSALEGLQVTVSDELSPALKTFVDDGTKWMGELTTAMQEGGFSGLLDKAMEILAELIVRFTDAIPDIVNVAFSMISQFISAIGEQTPQLIETAHIALDAFVGAFGQLMDQIMPIISDLMPTIIEYILTFKEMMFEVGLNLLVAIAQGISDNMDEIIPKAAEILTNLIDAIVEALPLLADAAANILFSLSEYITEHLPEISEKGGEIINALIDAIITLAPAVLDAVIAILVGIGAILLPYVEDAINAISEAWDNFKKWLSNKWEEIKKTAKDKWEEIKKSISEKVEDIRDKLEEIWENIKEKATEIWNNLKKSLSDIWTSIKTTTTTIWTNIKTFVSNTWNNIKTAATTTWNNIKNAIMTPINNAKTSISNVWTNIKNAATNVWQNIKNAASTAWQNIKNTITNKISNLPNDLLNVGKNMVAGLWNGISAKLSWIRDKIGSFAGGIISKVKSLFGIASPSKVFAEIGTNLALGLGKGWSNTYDKVADEIEDDLDIPDPYIGFGGGYEDAIETYTIDTDNMTSKATSASGLTAGSEYSTIININIDGTNISDSREMAETIAEKLQSLVDRRQAVWA